MSRLQNSLITNQKWYWTQDEGDLIIQAIKRERPLQELVLFHVSIDTMLRVSDLLELRVSDFVLKNGSIREVYILKQKKTGNKVQIVLHPPTRKVLAEYIEQSRKKRNDYLFTSKRNSGKPFTSAWMRYLVKGWATLIGLPEEYYSCHSTRRTGAIHLYKSSGHNIEKVRQALGHRSIEATKHYLGLEQKELVDTLRENPFWKT